jgi:hypothetical protein
MANAPYVGPRHGASGQLPCQCHAGRRSVGLSDSPGGSSLQLRLPSLSDGECLTRASRDCQPSGVSPTPWPGSPRAYVVRCRGYSRRPLALAAYTAAWAFRFRWSRRAEAARRRAWARRPPSLKYVQVKKLLQLGHRHGSTVTSHSVHCISISPRCWF